MMGTIPGVTYKVLTWVIAILLSGLAYFYTTNEQDAKKERSETKQEIREMLNRVSTICADVGIEKEANRRQDERMRLMREDIKELQQDIKRYHQLAK